MPNDERENLEAEALPGADRTGAEWRRGTHIVCYDCGHRFHRSERECPKCGYRTCSSGEYEDDAHRRKG